VNWFSGFWNYQAGVAVHKWPNFVTSSSGNSPLTAWVSSSDRCTNYRANGVDRSLPSMQSTACDGNSFRGDQICINTGATPGETSDFDIQAVLQYNRALSDAEVAQVELWLGYACPAGFYLNVSAVRKSAFPCLACPSGTWSVSVGAASSSTCLLCPVDGPSCPFNALPSCGSSPDCAPSVLLRGGAALNTSYWKNTANLPTLGSDGSFAFNRTSSQYLDKGQMTFSPGTYGFTATAKFQFTGTAGSWEALFDCGSGAPNNNLVFSRAETTATLTFYPCQGTSCTNHQWTLLSFIQNTVYIVTMVYDPSSASVAFYVGGALSQTVTGVPNLSTRTVSNCYIEIGRASCRERV
jgi:hypothetical protein